MGQVVADVHPGPDCSHHSSLRVDGRRVVSGLVHTDGRKSSDTELVPSDEAGATRADCRPESD